MKKTEKGFTLIELAIVIIIIGIVAVGILQGKSMIETIRMNRLISEIGKIENASLAFKSKYECVVGDCIKAKDFGLVPDTYPSYRTQAGDENDPYIPDGDEKIGPTYDEGYILFWTELYTSGLYTNTNEYGGEPTLRTSPYFDNGKKSIFLDFPYVSDINNIRPVDTWVIMYSLEPDDEMNANCQSLSACPAFTPAQLEQMDKKRDDGKPRTGNFKAAGSATMFGGSWFDLEFSDPSSNAAPLEADAGDPACVITGENEYNSSAEGTFCLPLFKLYIK